MAKALSSKQERMLQFIEGYCEEHGYPPSIREIQTALHISSTSVVDYNLRALESRGFLRRDRLVSRGLELTGRARGGGLRQVPLLGRIAAGEPIPVPDEVSVASAEWVDLPAELVGDRENVFALRVRGTSMIDALINDGDVVILQHQEVAENGDTVAAWLKSEKETTLKRFYREGARVRLEPANSTMQPIMADASNVAIQGKLIGVLRIV
jgi:repressor LexA